MACKKKKKNVKFKILIAIIILIAGIFCYFDLYVNPQIVSANTAQIKSVVTHVINSGIQATLQDNDYENLMTVEKNSDGKVSLITVNSKNVNKLNTSVISATQQNLQAESNMKIDVALGTFTGLPVLNGVGPNVSLKIQSVGSVNTKYLSQFSRVGINQSCHKIYLNITTTVCVIMPLYTQNIDVTSQVLVAECVIVGEIPNVYLNTDNLTNALNLIP